MAYRIFICRTDTPANAEEDPIGLQEWKALVRDTPQVSLYEGTEALPAYIQAPSASEGLARWAGHPRFDAIWFNHDKGYIYTVGYDAYVTMRMRTFANRLGAKVIDDNGRRY